MRAYHCGVCGMELYRDVNAARNMRARGFAMANGTAPLETSSTWRPRGREGNSPDATRPPCDRGCPPRPLGRAGSNPSRSSCTVTTGNGRAHPAPTADLRTLRTTPGDIGSPGNSRIAGTGACPGSREEQGWLFLARLQAAGWLLPPGLRIHSRCLTGGGRLV